MLSAAMESPAEEDVRFQGYRLEVISQWPPSPHKIAVAAAISQRLACIARGALMRPDITDLLHMSCQLLDNFFAADAAELVTHDPLDEETVGEALDIY
jgi:hypothetical protein